MNRSPERVPKAYTAWHGRSAVRTARALPGDGVEDPVSPAVGHGDPFAGRAEGDRSKLGQFGDDGEALVKPALEVPPLPAAQLLRGRLELTARLTDVVMAHGRHGRGQPCLVRLTQSVRPRGLGLSALAVAR